jgi:hypothetical protein
MRALKEGEDLEEDGGMSKEPRLSRPKIRGELRESGVGMDVCGRVVFLNVEGPSREFRAKPSMERDLRKGGEGPLDRLFEG